MKRHLTFLLALPLFCGGQPAAADPSSFKVVVNSNNPVVELSKRDLADIFLKEIAQWKNGVAVVAIDQPERSAIRSVFSKTVLGRSPQAIANYWARLIYSGRMVPPLTVQGDAQVLAQVAADPGAIGYLTADAEIMPGVKVIALLD